MTATADKANATATKTKGMALRISVHLLPLRRV
jgi:hypothetical protein